MDIRTWLEELGHSDPERQIELLRRWPQTPEAVTARATPVWQRIELLAARPDVPPPVRAAAWEALQSPAAQAFYARYRASVSVPWLLDYIRQWETEGLLTPEQAWVLRLRYGDVRAASQPSREVVEADRPAWGLGLSLALYLGAFLVLAAALLLALVFEGLRIPVLAAAAVLFAGLAWGLRSRTSRGSWVMAVVFYGLIVANALAWADVFRERLGWSAQVEHGYWAGVHALLAALAGGLAWAYSSVLFALALPVNAAWTLFHLWQAWGGERLIGLLWLWYGVFAASLALARWAWSRRPRLAKVWFAVGQLGLSWLLLLGWFEPSFEFDAGLWFQTALLYTLVTGTFILARRVRAVPVWDAVIVPVAVWMTGQSWAFWFDAWCEGCFGLGLLLYSLPVALVAWRIRRVAWAHPTWGWALAVVTGLLWAQSGEFLAAQPTWPLVVQILASLLVWFAAALVLWVWAAAWDSRALAWLSVGLLLRAYAHVLAEIYPGYLLAYLGPHRFLDVGAHFGWEVFQGIPGANPLPWWFAMFLLLVALYELVRRVWPPELGQRALLVGLAGWSGVLFVLLTLAAFPGETWTEVLVGLGLGVVVLVQGFRLDHAAMVGWGVLVLGWAWARILALLGLPDRPLVWAVLPVALALIDRFAPRGRARARAWTGWAYGLMLLVWLAALWALECLSFPWGSARCAEHSLALAVYASITGWYAWRWREIWLSLPTALLYFASYSSLLHALDVHHPQAYSVPAALLGLSLHALFRRAGYRWVAEGLGMLSQLILFTTTYVQMAKNRDAWYFAVLFLQALVVVGYGVLQRAASLIWTPVAFLVLGVITILVQQWRGYGVLVLLGCSGLLLLAGGLAFLLRQARAQAESEPRT
ncbi:MAG: hypothetical protein GXO36_00085 [Chloroflexi bacterium]|nr:hypothetical protein [Chloroflexota bacterium]